MNLFIIPSWYPEINNPIAGIFFKEQASYIAQLYKDINVGISLWGQSDYNLMISAYSPLTISSKISHYKNLSAKRNLLQSNLCEFYTPVLKWSAKILGGNFSKIIEANQSNLDQFERLYGKADIIHAHVSYPAGFIAMIISEKMNIPYIITEHMGPFPFHQFVSRNGTLSAKVAQPLKKAKQVIAVSPKLADDISSFGLPTPVSIPNVIDEDFFIPGKPVHPHPFKFFTLAALSPEKGINDLLEAISIVIASNRQVKFYIGGGGDMLDYYEAEAQKRGLQEHVQWLGTLTREEAKIQYQSCNAFVLPSHHETFGVVYAEAIACGIPVIATRCGGPEYIVNNLNGLFVNVGDSADLANKMLLLIDQYHNYSSQVIRKDFQEKFSKNTVIPKLVKIYNSVLQ